MKKPLAAAGWCLLVLLPVVACLARLVGHPGAFFDGEASIPATIGRELHLCGADLVFHYQLVAYQGSLVLDSLLSSVGYAVFGDHLLAWHSVPLLWLLMASAAGCQVLHRAVGPAGAVAWPLLLATAPFIVKDGLVSGIGGHAVGPAWGLAALALALAVDPDRRRSWLWALASGAVLALGAWHVRSAALAAPAVAVVCLRGGWRAVVACAVGLLLFPALIWFNLHALIEGGTYHAGTPRSDLIRLLLLPGNPLGESRPVLDKLGEASGWSLAPTFFLQPHHWQGAAPVRPGALLSGRLVVISWVAALPVLAGAAWLLRRRGDDTADRPRLLGITGVLLLVIAWPAAYVLRNFSVEDSVLDLLANLDPTAEGPTISATRYLVPACVCALVAVAAAAGLCWRGAWLRWAAVALLALPVGIGGWHAVADWNADRDAPGLYAEMDPFFYPGIQLPGRLPPPSVHLRCLNSDESSLAYHVEALALTSSRGLGPLLNEPELEGQVLRETIEQAGARLGGPGRWMLAVASGRQMGMEVQARQGDHRLAGLEAALRAWERVDPALAEPWMSGFVEGVGGPAPGPGQRQHLEGLCGELLPARRPGSCAP